MTCIAMLGGSGRLGQHIVRSLLADGHEVRALVHRQKVVSSNSNLKVVIGDVRDSDTVGELLTGVTAVLSTLGSAQAVVPDVCSVAAANLIPAMRARGITRIVATTGSAAREDHEIGFEHPHLIARRTALMPRMADLILDGEAQLRAFAVSGLAWTVVRLPRMIAGDQSPACLASTPPPPQATVGYEAAAEVIVGEFLTPAWIGRSPFAVRA